MILTLRKCNHWLNLLFKKSVKKTKKKLAYIQELWVT